MGKLFTTMIGVNERASIPRVKWIIKIKIQCQNVLVLERIFTMNTRREEREEKSGKVKLSVWYLTWRVVCCFFAQVQCCLYYLATLVEEVHTYQMRKGGRIQGFYIFQVWSQGAPTANRESQFFARHLSKTEFGPYFVYPSKKRLEIVRAALDTI